MYVADNFTYCLLDHRAFSKDIKDAHCEQVCVERTVIKIE